MQTVNYNSKIKEIYRNIRQIAPELPYHNLKHLAEVSNSCKRYAILEGLNLRDTYILATAGLLHDIVFIPDRSDNEERSTEVSLNILSKLDYSSKDIDDVSRLILATKFPTNPKDILEKIICDADLDYLGRYDFPERSELLRKEKGIDRKKWYTEIQPSFLNQVKYYTSSAKKLREHVLKENFEKVLKLKW